MSIEPTQPVQPNAPAPYSTGTIGRVADTVIMWVACHWLALFNTAWGIYVGAPFLAAILMQVGWVAPASVIYGIYSFLCHQLPDHSYFLFGPSLAPSREALLAAGMPNTTDIFLERAFIGNAEIGWKVALCQRDVAIYGAVFVTGILFALFRDRIKGLNWKWLVVFALPMAVDGLTQTLGWRESNWWLRTVTGALFGVGAVLWAYPFIDTAMRELIIEEEKRKAKRDEPIAEIDSVGQN
jgi:uncharacterized membrane protein